MIERIGFGAHAGSIENLGGAGRGRAAARVRRTGSASGPPHAGRRQSVSAGPAVAVAVTFVWVGMVVAISFVEAPLKFRAPDVTLPIGLGIGRLVFRALNTAEVAFTLIIGVIIASRPPPVGVIGAFVLAFAMLALQLVVVRPRLNTRSDEVLAGHQGPRSRAHYAYVGFEAIKAIALIVAGILLLSS
jgi:hypothetical protein